jgi:hypothetical protein
MTMPRRDRFIDGNLVKIRGHLNTQTGEYPAAEEPPSVPPGAAGPAAGAEPRPAVDPAWARERRQALARRADEFRALRRDVSARLVEKLAAIPEEIRIEEERMAELRDALGKFAALLDRLEAVDDSSWNQDCDFGAALGVAMRQAEGARLEHMRINAKLAALQRESAAADNSGRSLAALLPEFSSLSWRQGFRLGLCLGLPVILGVIAGALIVAITFILLWR